jgi:hypothetical protein
MDKVTYEQLKTAMTTYCRPKDTKAALYRFTGTRQEPEEALSDYVMRLKPLAYAGGISKANSDSEILRVIGQHANPVEVKLKCLEADMDTTKLVTWFATIETHQRCLRIESKSEDVNYVNNNNVKRKRPNDTTKKCNYCGGAYPHSGQCPARGATCNFCKLKDHYEAECRKKKASQAAPSTNQRYDGQRQNANRPRHNQPNNRNSTNRVFNVEEHQEDSNVLGAGLVKNAQLFKMFHDWLSQIRDTTDADGQQPQ